MDRSIGDPGRSVRHRPAARPAPDGSEPSFGKLTGQRQLADGIIASTPPLTAAIISHAVWLCHRFYSELRVVEDLPH